MSEDTKELKVVGKKPTKREFKEFERVEGKIYNDQLRIVLAALVGLPQKNPIAFEIGRAIKRVESASIAFEEVQSELMSEFLLRDEEGVWVVKPATKRMIEEARRDGKTLNPTVFAYVVDGDEDKEYKYSEAMRELLNTEAKVEFKSVDVKGKLVKVGDTKEPLIECLSDYFETGQINFLEEIDVLTGLDD